MAIGLGFDAVNSEHNRRTLSRILAQPIYRDALLMGKFLAGLATLAISLTALWLLVIGLGLIFLGVPPGGEEIARSLVFLVIAIFYAGVWLALAMLLSIVFRSPATAALVALGIWLFLTVLWPMLAPALAQVIAPPDPRYAALGLETPDTGLWTQFLMRISPNDLFAEAMQAILSPTTRTLGAVFLEQLRGAVMGAPLPLRRKHDDRLAADRQPDRRHHRAVCRRICDLSAAGGEGLSSSLRLLTVFLPANRAAADCRPAASAAARP